MDNSYSVKKIKRLKNQDLPDSLNYDGGKLFNLCLNLYTGFPLLDKPRNYIDSLLQDNAQVILISNNKFIHPENYDALPIESVIDTVKHSSTGIFCQRIDSNRLENRSGKTLCSASLGINKLDHNISAAILFDRSYGDSTTQKESYYNLLGVLRELYTDLTTSRAVTNLLQMRESYRYLINGDTGELVAKRLPTESGGTNDNLAETIFRKIQQGDISDEQDVVYDGQIKNLTMTRFQLGRFEYQLISFEIPKNNHKETANIKFEDNKLFRCFAHRIKNKLASLQTASSQLSLQAGNMIDDDDITLTKIIQSETEFLDELITRTRQLIEQEDPEFKQIDLIPIIIKAVADNKNTFKNNMKATIKTDLDNCFVTADYELIKTAFNEIIQNGFEAAENINIEISRTDKINIEVKNRLSKKMYEVLNNKVLDITEPYISLKPNRIGLGLSIASNILSLHNGAIETDLETNREMTVKITLPSITLSSTHNSISTEKT